MKIAEDHILIIFGASGDLTRRKLIPALYKLYKQGLLPDRFAVLGASRTRMDSDMFREAMKLSLSVHEDGENLLPFLQKLNYVSLNTADPGDYLQLTSALEALHKKELIAKNYIFYLSTPPSLYPVIPRGLALQGLNNELEGWRRLIIEKPFGTSLRTARELNSCLLKFFTEEQLYRIDHYLGKETVQNIMVTRFSNGIFEPLWNRNYVHHVEITSSESIGVEDRGGYYDQSGALRDMVQNHLLQLVALIAMEPPTVISASAIRNETLKVLQALRPYKRDDIATHVIRGQYLASTIRAKAMKAYREELNVPKVSRTETFVALKLFIDNWRWGGVPFYLRTGKRLPTRVTEIVIHFKPTPHKLFNFDEDRYNTDNQLVIRIQPDEGLLLKIGLKQPGAGYRVTDVNMDFHYADLEGKKLPEAYQRLLLDCMQGDPTLYTRADSVDVAWQFVDPILKEWRENCELQVYGYPAGTWGPQVSDSLIEGDNLTWRYPCKNLVDDGKYCEL